MDYAMNSNDCRSISGGIVFVNETHISFCSAMQKFVTLSVTKAKIVTGVMVAQDLLYVYRLLESLDLSVDLPTVFEMDSSGTVDIAKSR